MKNIMKSISGEVSLIIRPVRGKTGIGKVFEDSPRGCRDILALSGRKSARERR